jgi:hypothetical protein
MRSRALIDRIVLCKPGLSLVPAGIFSSVDATIASPRVSIPDGSVAQGKALVTGGAEYVTVLQLFEWWVVVKKNIELAFVPEGSRGPLVDHVCL